MSKRVSLNHPYRSNTITLTSCPIHGAAADSENMEGGSICNVVMGIGMYISYQPVALIVFVTS